MRDREGRIFLAFALGIALTGWTFGYGIPAAVTLWQPEPLPELAPVAAAFTHVGWGPSFDDLNHQVADIAFEAELASGMFPLEKLDCGAAQWDDRP